VPGLTHGAIVSVESAHGRIDATLALDERMLPGYVAVPMGAGHTAFGRWAKDFGANVLDLVRPGPAPGSGVNALCTTRVRISSGGAA
jgi:anaerobic selenocysteine-containing dehydrogenase